MGLRIRQRLRSLRARLGLEPVREVVYLGHLFSYPRDSLIGKVIAGGGEWDALLRTVVATMIPTERPLICEVGSNLGASLLQILAAKPQARVVAFEPSNRFRSLLHRNLARAGFSQVEIASTLVGRARARTRLHVNATTASITWSAYDGHEPRGDQLVEMVTLDDVLLNRGGVDFVKVDTDGFDFEVLRGAERLLREQRPLLFFELAPYLLTGALDDLDWLQSLGYRQLTCFTPTPTSRFTGITTDAATALAWADANGYCDVLACAEGSVFQTRLGGLVRSLEGARS